MGPEQEAQAIVARWGTYRPTSRPFPRSIGLAGWGDLPNRLANGGRRQGEFLWGLPFLPFGTILGSVAKVAERLRAASLRCFL